MKMLRYANLKLAELGQKLKEYYWTTV